MKRLAMISVLALVIGGLAACTPPASLTCNGAQWCALPNVGMLGASATSYPSGITDVGDVLFTTYQPTGLTGDPIQAFPAADVFLYHRLLGTYTRLSDASGTADGSITPDGHYAATYQSDEFTHTTSITYRDLTTGASQVIGTDAVADPTFAGDRFPAPLIAPDGSLVAWSVRSGSSGCPTCVTVKVWTASSGTVQAVSNEWYGYAVTLDSQGYYYGPDEGGRTYASLTGGSGGFETFPSRPAPPLTSVDGRFWVRVTSTSALLVDRTNGTSTDLGLPAGFVAGSGARALISGDGHHVVLSDAVHIWQRDV